LAWNTAWLVRASVKAEKAGRLEELERLRGLIEGVQQRCSHACPKGSTILTKDSKNGKYAKGGTIHWCLLCGQVQGYDPP
jgi:hypothetical protein